MGCSTTKLLPFEAKAFSVEGTHDARVVDVHSGDQMTVVFRWAGEFRSFKVRVLGVETPAMCPTTHGINRVQHIRRAQLARDSVHAKLFKNVVQLQCEGMDPCGRVLARVRMGKTWDLADWLIATKLGAKSPPVPMSEGPT